LKTVAKLLRMSHPNPDFPATGKFQHNGGGKKSVKTTGAGRLHPPPATLPAPCISLISRKRTHGTQRIFVFLVFSRGHN
jgi:hypothetical protein